MPQAKAMNHNIPYCTFNFFLFRLALAWQKDLPHLLNENEILTTDYRNASSYNLTIVIVISTNTSQSEFDGDEYIHKFPNR